MKGLVCDIDSKGTVILTEQGEFVRIPREESHIIGGRIECVRGAAGGAAAPSAVRRRGAARRRFREAVAAAACIAAILGGYLFCDRWQTVEFSVYMDINPSIRMEVNTLGRLVEVSPVNRDGLAFLREVDIKGDLAAGLKTAAREASARDLIQSGGIGIAVVTADDAKVRKVTDVIEKALPLMKLSFVYLTPEEEQEAYAVGVAPVRWKMAQIVAERYPRLDVETAMRLEKNYLFGLYRGDESYPPKY